jgi:hypothetical protein
MAGRPQRRIAQKQGAPPASADAFGLRRRPVPMPSACAIGLCRCRRHAPSACAVGMRRCRQIALVFAADAVCLHPASTIAYTMQSYGAARLGSATPQRAGH